MARIENGPFGNISGRVGNVVVYMLNGKMVMRSLPSVKRKKASGRQKETQDLFANVVKPVRAAKSFIKIGFSGVKGFSAYHSALSLNLQRMSENGQFSYSKMIFSKGKLAAAIEPVALIDSDLKLTISWQQNEPGKPLSDDDNVLLLVINTSQNRAEYDLNAGKRSAGQASIQLMHTEKGNHLEVYIAFAKLTGAVAEVSDSVWAGQIEV